MNKMHQMFRFDFMGKSLNLRDYLVIELVSEIYYVKEHIYSLMFDLTLITRLLIFTCMLSMDLASD